MNGIRLKKRRKELGLSGEKIAQELGTTRVTVSRWETGTSEPDDKTKLELARLLNTTVSYLIGETDNPEKFVTAKTDTSFYMKGSENMVGKPTSFEVRKIQNKLFDIANSIADLYKDANRVIREELYANEVEFQKLDDIQRTCVDLLKVLHPSF